MFNENRDHITKRLGHSIKAKNNVFFVRFYILSIIILRILQLLYSFDRDIFSYVIHPQLSLLPPCEISRNTHKTQQAKDLVSLDGFIAKSKENKMECRKKSKLYEKISWSLDCPNHCGTIILPLTTWQNLKGY